MKIITAAFLLLVASCAPAFAECLKPTIVSGAGVEHYTDPLDVVKLPHSPQTQGADEVVIVLGPQTNAAGQKAGIVYYLKKGCVIFSVPANEAGVQAVLLKVGVNRQTPKIE